MHRTTRLSAATLLAASALVLPVGLQAATAPTTPGTAVTAVADVGTEGAAEHESMRIRAIIANVGREGAAEHETARLVSQGAWPFGDAPTKP